MLHTLPEYPAYRDNYCLDRWIYSIFIIAHRRTSREVGELEGGVATPRSQAPAKPLFFGQKLNFSRRSHIQASSQKMKKVFFLYLLNEKKTEFIPSSEIECPKSGISTNNYCVGWVGQSNFVQVCIGVFFGRCQKKMAQPPLLEKIGPYAYEYHRCLLLRLY